MADVDPLAGQNTQPTASVDPLAGWQPNASPPPVSNPPPPPQKGILETSYPRGQPSATNKGDPWGEPGDANAPQRIRAAASDAFTTAPSLGTEPGNMSPITRAYQEQMNRAPEPFGWVNRNIVNPGFTGLGYAAGGAAAGGAAAAQTVNELLAAAKTPPALQRDINMGAAIAPAVLATTGGIPPSLSMHPADAPVMRELLQPPPASLSELLQRQRAIPSTDPVTSNAISILRRNAGTTNMPQPPTPFTTSAAPSAAPTPNGGLLNIPPSPGGVPTMTADEILARSQGFYSPADKQAAQGATIGASSADGIRGVLTDAVPADPQKAAAVGSTPLIQLGKDYQQFQGQPMSYDTAMALDRRLTDERQAALRSGNNTLASQIEDAQGKIRDKVQSVDPGDTTGDPKALAMLPQARQAYSQYIKQRQIEDLKYDASLLPDDKQSAYLTSRGNAMLRGNQTRNWTDDERTALEQSLKSGQPSALTSFGISLIKPAAQATGGVLGGSAFGPVGGLVGGQVGGTLGEGWAAKLRNAVRQVTLDPVSRTISQGVPPPGQ